MIYRRHLGREAWPLQRQFPSSKRWVEGCLHIPIILEVNVRRDRLRKHSLSQTSDPVV